MFAVFLPSVTGSFSFAFLRGANGFWRNVPAKRRRHFKKQSRTNENAKKGGGGGGRNRNALHTVECVRIASYPLRARQIQVDEGRYTPLFCLLVGMEFRFIRVGQSVDDRTST